MSFRETSAWISLLSILAVFGFYFTDVALALRAGPVEPERFLGEYIGAVVLLVIVQIVLSIMSAIAMRASAAMQSARDEREHLIELKANRFALFVVQAGVVTVAGAIALGVPGYITANGLVLALAAGELVRFGGQVVYYRVGV